jgi:hypothetical protein
VATYSTYLNLKLNAGSDPFLLSDFINNWDILDTSPGVYICTSLTRPSWGTAQAGRKIFMTDLEQTQFWNGSSWQDERNSVPTFAYGVYLNTSMNRNSSPQFTIMQFSTPRPCAMAIILTAVYNCNNQQSQDLYQNVLFDGATINLGSFREQIRFEGNAADAGGQAGQVGTSIAIMPALSAGSHSVGLECQVGSYSSAITLIGAKVLGFIALYTSSNSL